MLKAIALWLLLCLSVNAVVYAPLYTPTYGQAFFVSSAGSDANNGLTTNTPFLTIGKANSAALPGSIVSFRGGDVFSDAVLSPISGTSNFQTKYCSYGVGQATITNITNCAVGCTNQQYFTLSNLTISVPTPNIVGSNLISCLPINIWVNSSGNTVYGAFHILSNTITGGFCSIGVFTPSSTSDGYANSEVAYNKIRDATEVGLYFWNNASAGTNVGTVSDFIHYSNLHIFGNEISNITGDHNSNTRSSGDGIAIAGVRDSVWESNYVHDLAQFAQQPPYGPAGIFPQSSSNVVIQNNLVCRVHTSVLFPDGDGIGCDLNVTNSIVQYNKIYDCDGPGVYNITSGSNIFRFNEVINCSRNSTLGNAYFQSGAIVYNNTFTTRSNVCLATGDANSKFYNNIIITETTLSMITVNNGTVLLGNSYSDPRTAGFSYGGTNYASFSAFRTGSGQEVLTGTNYGFGVDPLLVQRYTAIQLTNTADIVSSNQLAPMSGSVASQSAVVFSGIGNAGGVDIRGVALRTPYNIGAWDVTGSRTPTNGSYLRVVQSDAPLIYLRMNEPSGNLFDTSGNLYNINNTVTSATQNANPIFPSDSKSISFNGTSGYATMGSNIYIGDTYAMSVEFCVSNWPSSGSRYVAGQWNSDASTNRWLVDASSGKIEMNVSSPTLSRFFSSTGTLNANSHHVIITWTGTTMHIYVDNVDLAGTQGGPSGNNIVYSPLYNRIAASSDNTPSNYTPMNMSDLSVYNYVLTSTQVAAHYAAVTNNIAP